MSSDGRDLGLAGILFYRLVWCDNGGVIRGKAVHADAMARSWVHGVGISAAQQSVPACLDAVAPGSGLGPVGEVRLAPDRNTLRILPWATSHARMCSDMVVQGAPWPLCPRGFLRKMISQAHQAGFDFWAAFENEFYLLREVPGASAGASAAFPGLGGLAPVDNAPFAATLAMDVNREVVDDIALSLLSQGIPVEQYYPESGPGQQEISIGYAGALEAADRQIAFRETVHAVARRHGLRATFLPKPFPDAAGSGSHVHFSLWQQGLDIVGRPPGPKGLSPTAGAFTAGILHHLAALMAVTTPSVNSYRRIRPGCWSGAYRAWGMDNREAAVRVPSEPTATPPLHIELKTVDATCNPYLALGAILAVGLDGVQKGMSLPDPIQSDPAGLDAEARAAAGADSLPDSLDKALAAFRQDEALATAMGPGLFQAFTAVRSFEWERMKNLDHAGEVQALLERY